jgi:hypothetical protein
MGESRVRVTDVDDETASRRPLVSLRDLPHSEAGPARLLVVLGMHRSGTSAVAQLLGSNGAHLGDPEQLIPANEYNPRGHFESLDLSEFNEHALSVMSAPWWAPPTIETVQAGAEDLVPGARQVWRRRGSGGQGEVALVKDPRFSLLLPIWRPVFGPDTLYVVCVRNPIGVARSLLARDKIDLTVGVGLWEAYNIACLHGLTGSRALFVDVDSLMVTVAAREDLVRRVRTAVGLEQVSRIDDTFEPDLIAGASTPHELFEHLSGSQLALYQSLANLPAEPVVVDDLRHLRVPAPTLRVISRNRKVAVETAAMQGSLDVAVSATRAARQDAEAARQEAEAARHEAEAARRNVGAARLDAERAHQELAATAGLVTRLSDERDEARGQASASSARADRVASELVAIHDMYGRAFASRSWRWTKPFRREGRDKSGHSQVLQEPARPRDGWQDPPGRPTVPYADLVIPDFSATARSPMSARIAVVVHLFYPDLWQSLAEQLGNLQEDYDLFVSLTEGHSSHLANTIQQRFPLADVQVVENRGRDMAPFFGFVSAGKLDNYAAVLKLHTKRSHHRIDGDSWRDALWHGLLPNPTDATQFADLVSTHPDVGCIVPAGNVMTSEFLGSNVRRMTELLARLGLDFRVEEVEFPAGSMYWLDGDVVQLLKALSIDPVNDFEMEEGQIDGTTAHALERVVGVLLKRRGQTVAHAEDARRMSLLPDWAARRRPKVLAFFLPQFHPIAENDVWWGEGFTEWTNVEAATSWHPGQRYPRLPARTLGRYDLTCVEVPRLQSELARAYGIDGFLVYHYWFSGKRLLEAPMDLVLANPDVDFPYALVWANENWTRSWDGLDADVLIKQEYEPGWESGLFSSLLPHLQDKRYLHVDGHPLVVLFKPGLIPDLGTSVSELRRLAEEQGVGQLHIAGILHERHVPAKLQAIAAVDSWIEFPPLSGPSPVEVTDQVIEAEGARGKVYSYRGLVDEQHFLPLVQGRRVHPGVIPSWDNTPRRKTGASSFVGSNAADFRRWLIDVRKHLASRSAPGEMLVCINAWNEWAETAYLEPDQLTGVANLEAVRSAFGHVEDVAAAHPGLQAHGTHLA